MNTLYHFSPKKSRRLILAFLTIHLKKLNISFPDANPAPTKVPIKTKIILNINSAFKYIKIYLILFAFNNKITRIC